MNIKWSEREIQGSVNENIVESSSFASWHFSGIASNVLDIWDEGTGGREKHAKHNAALT
jgi:hypothetical protein